MLTSPSAPPKRARTNSRLTLILIPVGVLALLGGLAVLYVLDKALMAKTVSQRDASGTNFAQTQARGNTSDLDKIFSNAAKGNTAAAMFGAAKAAGSLKPGDINASNARAALRSAPAESIQEAVRAKTGKNVSVGQIEKARARGLSSDGQKKINEAMKRRGEVDISKIRARLGQ